MPRQKSTPSKHGENGQPPPLISNADLKTEIGKFGWNVLIYES